MRAARGRRARRSRRRGRSSRHAHRTVATAAARAATATGARPRAAAGPPTRRARTRARPGGTRSAAPRSTRRAAPSSPGAGARCAGTRFTTTRDASARRAGRASARVRCATMPRRRPTGSPADDEHDLVGDVRARRPSSRLRRYGDRSNASSSSSSIGAARSTTTSVALVARRVEHGRPRPFAHLGPELGARQPGEHPQPVRSGLQAASRGARPAVAGQPGRLRDRRRLGQARAAARSTPTTRRRRRAAPSAPRRGRLDREVHRDRRPAGRAGAAPHRDQPPATPGCRRRPSARPDARLGSGVPADRCSRPASSSAVDVGPTPVAIPIRSSGRTARGRLDRDHGHAGSCSVADEVTVEPRQLGRDDRDAGRSRSAMPSSSPWSTQRRTSSTPSSRRCSPRTSGASHGAPPAHVTTRTGVRHGSSPASKRDRTPRDRRRRGPHDVELAVADGERDEHRVVRLHRERQRATARPRVARTARRRATTSTTCAPAATVRVFASSVPLSKLARTSTRSPGADAPPSACSAPIGTVISRPVAATRRRARHRRRGRPRPPGTAGPDRPARAPVARGRGRSSDRVGSAGSASGARSPG